MNFSYSRYLMLFNINKIHIPAKFLKEADDVLAYSLSKVINKLVKTICISKGM